MMFISSYLLLSVWLNGKEILLRQHQKVEILEHESKPINFPLKQRIPLGEGAIESRPKTGRETSSSSSVSFAAFLVRSFNYLNPQLSPL